MNRVRGVVLHTVRYGDAQVIVSIFTETHGTVSFIVRRSQSHRARLAASVWQPLSLVEVVWNHRPRLGLQKPSELTLWHPWRDLPFHPHKATIGLFLGEFLYRALRTEQENSPLFDFIVNALLWLDEAEESFANFHLVFLLHLTRFLGFLPNVEDWHVGSYFDLQGACFTGIRPKHAYYLEPEEAAMVPKFLRMDIRSMRAVGLNGAMRRRVLEIVIDFYRLHVPEFPALKSLDVLTDVFRT